jgi:hypothetical protein
MADSGRTQNANERKEKVWMVYQEVLKEMIERHGEIANEVRKVTVYNEVSDRTGYAAAYVGKIVHERLARESVEKRKHDNTKEVG